MAEQNSINSNIHFGILILNQSEYNELKKDSEQLRILKNYIKNNDVIFKEDITKVINAMESERVSNE